MTTWSERPTDEARLFNPAFLAALIGAAAENFETRAKQAMPLLIAFLVLPIALHAPTRSQLPKTIAALFPNWLQAHPEIRLGYPSRAVALVGLTQEAIRFGVLHGGLDLSGDAVVAASRFRPVPEATEDVRDCFKAAGFCGRWFTKHDVPTLFALLGVKP
jgi:Family of unknown function (DUF6521)